ncbi:MAG TPA: DUF362 domain-containing protein [Bacteroidales bacterium]|nr:DUF362 domain-containing protein [Bacteroidales bacterium]
MTKFTRRNFIKTSVIGGVAAAYARPVGAFATSAFNPPASSKVAITSGNNRADMAFRALQPFAAEISNAIGNKRVILKPNIVNINLQLASTHVDTLEGILEFLKSINKAGNVIIAESAANGPTLDGFENFGYFRLASRYNVKMMDLDRQPYDTIWVFDEKDFKPHPVRMSHLMLDPDSYIVSVARMKTHDRVLATLSLKNIVLGAPVKDPGFTFDSSRKAGAKSDKPIMHGSGFRGINYNLYSMSQHLHPHLAVIDGFEGMEGNGPNDGTPVDHRVCVAGTDWLSADRVGIELMGIDFADIGYLNFCTNTGPFNGDLDRIEVIGETIEAQRKHYRLSDNIKDQLIWKDPVADNTYKSSTPGFKLSYT